ncbi:peptidoglycan DD-metalloendopeptidase family protein [Bacillus sp. FSL W7-1360]
MSRIEGLSIALDLDSIKVERGLTGLKDKLKTVNSEMKSNMSAFDRSDKSIGKYETRLNGLNKKLEVQKQVTNEAKAEYEKMVAEHGEGSKQAEKAAREYNNQAAALNNLERYVGGVKKELEQLVEEQRIAQSGWTKLGNGLDKVGTKLTNIGAGMQEAGKRMTMAITAPVVALSGALVATGVGYKAFKQESQQAFSVLLGSAKEAEKHMDRIMDFAKTTPFAFPDLVSANRKLVSFGMEAEKTGAVMEAMANSTAAMGGSGQDIVEMADIFAKITANGKITGEELNRLGDRGVNALQILANQAGVSMDSMRNQISNGAIKSEKAINWLVDGMMNGTKGVNGATVAMGGSLDALKGTWAGAVDSFKGAWRRAGDAVVSDKLFNNMTGAVNKATDVIGRLPDLVGPIADRLGNIFISIIDVISNLVDRFFALDPALQQVVVNMGALLVAAGPALFLFGGIAKVVGHATKFFAPFAHLIAKTGGFFKFMLNPVGLTVGAIAGLAIGAVVAYRKFEPFRQVVHSVGNAFISAYNSVKEFLTTNETVLMFVEMIKAAFNDVVAFFGQVFVRIKAFWDQNGTQMLDAIKNGFTLIWMIVKPIIDGIVMAIQVAWPTISAIITSTMTIISGVISSVWGGIKAIISGALDVIMGVVKVFTGLLTLDFAMMWDGVKQIFGGALTMIGGVWNTIKGIFMSVVGAIVGFVKTHFSGMWGNIKGVFNAISSFTGQVWNGIKSKVVDPVVSLAATVWGKFKQVKDRVVQIFNDIKTSVADRVSDMIEGVKAMPGKMGDGLKKMAKKIGGGVIAVINFMVRKLGDGVNGIIGGINWVLDKVGIKDAISKWDVPQWAHGTRGSGHPGGPAVVGDGKGTNAGQELIETPDGKQFLSPATPTLLNLPKGTHVLSARDTRKLIGMPKYAKGTWELEDEPMEDVEGDKGILSKIWDAITDPVSLLKSGLAMLGVKIPKGVTVAGKAALGGFNKVFDAGKGWIKSKIDGFFGGDDGNGGGGSGRAGWGAPFRLTSAFNPGRRHPITGRIQAHRGDDWAAPQGTPIPAQAGGRVSFSGRAGGFGNLIRIVSGELERYYAHNMRNFVRVGQIVQPGQTIGLVGSTGDSTGPHVHYEVRRRGVPINPRGFATGGLINKDGFYRLAEGGYPEFVIPTDPSRRTDAMKLLALAGKQIAGNKSGNKRPHQLSHTGASSGDTDDSLLKELIKKIDALLSQSGSNQPINIHIAGHKVASILGKDMSRYLGNRTRSDEVWG